MSAEREGRGISLLGEKKKIEEKILVSLLLLFLQTVLATYIF